MKIRTNSRDRETSDYMNGYFTWNPLISLLIPTVILSAPFVVFYAADPFLRVLYTALAMVGMFLYGVGFARKSGDKHEQPS